MRKLATFLVLLGLIGLVMVPLCTAQEGISAYKDPVITFPSANSTLVKGQTYTISWTGSDIGVDNYSVYLFGGSSGNREVRFLGLASTSQKSFNWTVPLYITAGSGYIIQLSGVGVTGVNSNAFSISNVKNLTVADIYNAPIPSPLADYESVWNGTAEMYNLKNGSYLTPGCATSGEDCLGIYIDDNSIIFGDLNGDGIDDAVAVADNYCGMPLSCGKTILGWINDNGSPRFVDLIAGYRSIDSLTIKDELLTVDSRDINDTRFLSHPAEVRYELSDPDCSE